MVQDKKNILANFEYYKIFYFVAKYGNITAAAQALYLTQPTITKAIQNLEEQLECKLFVRSHRGVDFTNEGRMLWERVQPACQMLFTAEEELLSAKRLESGTLRLVSTEMSFKTYILPALSTFMENHPNVKFKFMNALNSRTSQLLKAGASDLAIMHSPFPTEDVNIIREIAVIHEHFVVGEKYRFLAQQENSLETLLQYPFVAMPEGSSTRDYLNGFFNQHGLLFEPDIEITTIELACDAVQRGLGIGTLPDSFLEHLPADAPIYKVPLKIKLPPRKACLICAKNIPLSFASQAFVEECFRDNVT